MQPAQIKAARALLGWRQEDLANASGLSTPTIKGIESGRTDCRGSTIEKVVVALQSAGVEIIPGGKGGGPGVRLS